MHFVIDHSNGGASNAALVYRPDEYSFAVEPVHQNGFASVLFDDLNLEIDSSGRIISVWGMCPHTRWQRANLTPPKAEPGNVIFIPDTPIRRGVSTAANEKRYEKVFFDPDSGWLHVGGIIPAPVSTQIMPGVILEFGNAGDLRGIWLKPHNLSKNLG